MEKKLELVGLGNSKRTEVQQNEQPEQKQSVKISCSQWSIELQSKRSCQSQLKCIMHSA